MSEKRFKVIDDDFSKWIVDTTLKEDKHEGAIYTAYDMCHKLNELYEENEQLHYELQQIKEYLQIKIDECKNYKKMEEIVFGVEQAVGYEKALLQFQKGLKRRLNNE